MNIKFNKIKTSEESKNNPKEKITLKEIGLEKLVIIFLCGVFLIVLSFPNLFTSKNTQKTSGKYISSNSTIEKQTSKAKGEEEIDRYTSSLETELKEVLAKVNGIGAVDVMITVKSSKELVPLKDAPYTQDNSNEIDGSGGSRVSSNINKEDSTVLITNEQGETTPYIVKEIEPEIKGVLVIAEGGNNQTIINEIVEAVEVLFDVPTHKIKVMKMN